MSTRENIIQSANKFLGTPYHHQGRSINGVDCAGLIVCICKENGFDLEDLKGYSRLPKGNKIAEVLNKNFEKIKFDDAKDGDILLFRFRDNPQHLAFITFEDEIPYIIHAFGDATINEVVKNRLDEVWFNLLVATYRIRGIE